MSSVTTVNGFVCRDCTDVDYAKKHIDPAKPKDGPYGVNAPDKADKADAAAKTSGSPVSRDRAVTFGGALAALGTVDLATAATPAPTVGSRVNLLA